MQSYNIVCHGQNLTLSGQRVAFHPESNSLLVADLHLGKDSTFRQSGIPVPAGATERTLARLKSALDHFGATACYILGDLIHAQSSLIEPVFNSLNTWFTTVQNAVNFHLILGNHDQKSKRRLAQLPIAICEHSVELGQLTLTHDVATANGVPKRSRHASTEDTFVIAGHLHPCYRFGNRSASSPRLPCFWRKDASLILPAFGEFTGLANIRRERGEQVFLVCDDELVLVEDNCLAASRLGDE